MLTSSLCLKKLGTCLSNGEPSRDNYSPKFRPSHSNFYPIIRYGTPKFPLSRQVITRGLAQTPALEVYPPRLRGHVLTSSPSDEAREPAYFIVSETLSLKSLYQTILQNACGEEPPLSATGTRIWKLAEGSNWDKLHYPATQLQKDGATLIDSESIRSVVEALIETGDAFVVERQVDGHWIADMNTIPPTRSGITTPQATPGETPKLFGSGADFFSRLQSKTSPPSTSVVKATASSSGALKPPLAIKAGPSSFTRSKAPKLEPGTLGLGNM